MHILNPRQTATVLAALRYWQRHQASQVGRSKNVLPEDDIATDGGTLEPMSPDEIDTLCELLNSNEPKPRPVPPAIGGKPSDFHVTWTIDAFDMPNHRAAAEHALNTQRNPESIATVFMVRGADGKEVLVDLSETDDSDSSSDSSEG